MEFGRVAKDGSSELKRHAAYMYWVCFRLCQHKVSPVLAGSVPWASFSSIREARAAAPRGGALPGLCALSGVPPDPGCLTYSEAAIRYSA